MSFDFKKIAATYDTRAKDIGLEDFRKVGWGSVESQNLRFDILSQIGDLHKVSVLDVGCGLGDFYKFLALKKYDLKKFTGVDISPELIKIAKERYPLPHTQFIASNFLEYKITEKFDYGFLSGSLNLKGGDNYEVAFKTLKLMYDNCEKGIAVNFLSSYVDYQQDKDFHFEPEIIFKYCKGLTKRVTLRHDYPLYEFTVYLYKV